MAVRERWVTEAPLDAQLTEPVPVRRGGYWATKPLQSIFDPYKFQLLKA